MNRLWAEAQVRFVGGVNSPVRAFKAVGGEPVFMKRGKGAYLFDHQDRQYIDYCLSWGALLFGHADKETAKAIHAEALRGTSFGTATEYELLLAREIQKAFPDMEKIRYTSSGTEAAMSAIRLARGFTHKERIVKFDGCYHGHSDSLLVKAGSGLATFGAPDSGGVPASLAKLTSVLPYNNISALERFKNWSEVACIVIEPVAGNMGVVPAQKEFLAKLRQLATKHRALLIFDEVISGFRVAYGGAQHVYGIKPDLTILGKIIGGGLPVGAFGGSAKIMNSLSPVGNVYQAGTLSGNPISMVAGASVLSRLSAKLYSEMNLKTAYFTNEARKIFKQRALPLRIQAIGSMFTIFFTEKEILNFEDTKYSDLARFKNFFHTLLSHGVYSPPSQFESWFLSARHTTKDLDRTLEIFKKC